MATEVDKFQIAERKSRAIREAGKVIDLIADLKMSAIANGITQEIVDRALAEIHILACKNRIRVINTGDAIYSS